MTVIYVDTLFLLNAYITMIQLAAAARLTRTHVKGLSLLASCLVGGASGLLMLWNSQPMAAWLCGILCGPAEVLIAFGYKNLKAFAKRLLIFFGVGIAVGGAALLVSVRQPQAVKYAAGAVYFEISPLLLIGITLGCYLLIRLYYRLTSGQPTEKASATVTVDGRTLTLPALADSGNLLRDATTQSPVAIAAYSDIKPLLPDSTEQFFCHLNPECCEGKWKTRVRILPGRSIGGERLIAAFRPDTVTVNIEGKRRELEGVLIAVVPEKMDEFSIILPAEAMKE